VVLDVDDELLVRAAQNGDLDAFEILVRRHQQRIFRLALRITGSRPDAEDAAQESFLQAWRSLRRFRGDSSFSTWMHRIATNRCLNLIAARPTQSMLPDTLPAAAEGDPATIIEGHERMEALQRGVQALPAEARAVLVLREFQGLRYEEIADVLDITLPAVKGRIHRARLQLIEAMSQWH
jgi:RNA polymerase sigma-70 factor (ECF subfamily)